MKNILTCLICIILLSSCSLVEDYKEQKVIDDFERELEGMFEENEARENNESQAVKKESIYSDEARLWKSDSSHIFYEYYWNIVSDPNIAYGLKYNPDISFKAFKDLYSETSYIRVLKLDLQDEGMYNAEILLRSYNKLWIDIYKVTWRIIDNKIQSLTSIKKPDIDIVDDIRFMEIIEEVSQGNFRAYIQEYDSVQSVYLENNATWAKVLLDKVITSDAFSWDRDIFYDIDFYDTNILSYQGNKILPTSYLYNLKTYKWFYYDSELDNAYLTLDNKYIFTCVDSGMWGWELKIYNYPGLTLKKEVFPGEVSNSVWLDCSKWSGYDSDRNIFRFFQFHAWGDNEYELNFDTLEINKLWNKN